MKTQHYRIRFITLLLTISIVILMLFILRTALLPALSQVTPDPVHSESPQGTKDSGGITPAISPEPSPSPLYDTFGL